MIANETITKATKTVYLLNGKEFSSEEEAKDALAKCHARERMLCFCDEYGKEIPSLERLNADDVADWLIENRRDILWLLDPPTKPANFTHQTYESGGGITLDHLVFPDGVVLSVSEDCVLLYQSMDDCLDGSLPIADLYFEGARQPPPAESPTAQSEDITIKPSFDPEVHLLRSHTWNTGRPYTEKGQRVAAAVIRDSDTGIQTVFLDVDRMIFGKIQTSPDWETASLWAFSQYVMGEYDNLRYEGGYWPLPRAVEMYLKDLAESFQPSAFFQPSA